jgi:hypothetical protein
VSFQSLRLLQQENETKSLKYKTYFRTKRTERNTSAMAPPEYKELYFTAVAFCRLACLVINERIELDSVTAQTSQATTFLRDTLKANGGADFVASAHLTAMEFGRAYLVPSGSERTDGTSVIQVIPGRDMVHALDPYTGEVLEALRVYGSTRERYVYYTRDSTTYLDHGPGPEGFVTIKKEENETGKVSVFPLLCRGEVNDTFGRPEAKDAFTLQDSACRIATDMAIASATMAVPQRALLGAEPEDFAVVDPATGNPKVNETGAPILQTADQLYTSRLLLLNDPAAKIAEYSAAQLQNFSVALNSVTRQAAAILGVPQSVFGVSSDANPASGDAQRQDDDRLIRRAEQLTRGFEPGWIDLFKYLLEVTDGFEPEEVFLRFMDPRLPNRSANADAVTKLAQIQVGDQPLYEWDELRRMLGDSDIEIEAARQRRELAAVTRVVNQAGAEE